MTATDSTITDTTSGSVARPGDGVRLTALAIGFVMATLDVTVVNVAGVSVARDLHLGVSGLTWVLDGYILTFASLLLLAGALANRYGAKRVYLLGLTVFVVASVLCGVAQNGTMLIGARLLQGVGAALFMPSSLGLLMAAFPEEKRRATMLGLWTAIVSTASGLGPVIGGVLVDLFGWRSIFLLNIPLGIVGALLTARVIAAPPARPGPVTVVSNLAGVAFLGAASFALIEGPSLGWTDPLLVAAYVLLPVAAAVFALAERASASPLLPRTLLRNRVFAGSNAIGFLLNFALFGTVFMLGILFQQGMGASPFDAGLRLLPVMIVFVLGNLTFARIAKRAGSRVPMLVALIVATVGSATMIAISTDLPYAVLAVVVGLVNLGVGITVPAMTATLMTSAGREHANMAGALLNANRQVGSLLGVAAAGTLIASNADRYRGASLTFAVAAVAYLIAAGLAWSITRSGAPAGQR